MNFLWLSTCDSQRVSLFLLGFTVYRLAVASIVMIRPVIGECPMLGPFAYQDSLLVRLVLIVTDSILILGVSYEGFLLSKLCYS